jgi:hypothetical protein
MTDLVLASPVDLELGELLKEVDSWDLAPHGSICVEVMDGDPPTGLPHLFPWSLAYGRNLLDPSQRFRPWRVRNVIAHCRPSGPEVGDRFSPAVSYITVATRARDRWFDLDAVRTPHQRSEKERAQTAHRGADNGRGPRDRKVGAPALATGDVFSNEGNPAGAPPLDWWRYDPVATRKRLIDAMCPARVCTTCGQPSRRLTEQTEEYAAFRADRNAAWAAGAHEEVGAFVARAPAGGIGAQDAGGSGARGEKYRTVGWTDCGHGTWRAGVVREEPQT